MLGLRTSLVPLFAFNDSTNSSVRFWTEFRQAGHKYAFDLLDGIHLTVTPRIAPSFVEELFQKKYRRRPQLTRLAEKRSFVQLLKRTYMQQPQWITSSGAYHDRTQVTG
jgi:hypothetical protein